MSCVNVLFLLERRECEVWRVETGMKGVDGRGREVMIYLGERFILKFIWEYVLG